MQLLFSCHASLLSADAGIVASLTYAAKGAAFVARHRRACRLRTQKTQLRSAVLRGLGGDPPSGGVGAAPPRLKARKHDCARADAGCWEPLQRSGAWLSKIPGKIRLRSASMRSICLLWSGAGRTETAQGNRAGRQQAGESPPTHMTWKLWNRVTGERGASVFGDSGRIGGIYPPQSPRRIRGKRQGAHRASGSNRRGPSLRRRARRARTRCSRRFHRLRKSTGRRCRLRHRPRW